MKHAFRVLLIAACFSNVLQIRLAFAWPPTYGSEYNFGSDEMKKAFEERRSGANAQGLDWQKPGEAEWKTVREFAEKIHQRCWTECTVTPNIGKFGGFEYKVKFRDGYGFNISADPACVEIQTQPETLAQMKKNEARAQEFIFSVAKELKLKTRKNSADFNIGIRSAFEHDPKGFMRFFINYHNLPELSSGALGKEYGNAPPISHLYPKQREALAKIVEDVNSGILKSPQKIAARIEKEVYIWTPKYNEDNGAKHYQGIGLKYASKPIPHFQDRPFELRAPRQPESAHERTLLAELMEKRMEFEKKESDPIAFVDPPKEETYSYNRVSNRFRLYVAEAGGDFDHFKDLLHPVLRSEPPDAFMSGKINWSSAEDIENLKGYTRYLSNSSWVRNKMESYLSSPEAVASGKVPEILKAAEANLGKNANSQAVKFVRKIIGAEKESMIPAQCMVKNIESSLGK